MNTHLDIGMAAWDRWTRQLVTVVAGAQAEGYVTIAFDGGPVAAIRREHLTGYAADNDTTGGNRS